MDEIGRKLRNILVQEQALKSGVMHKNFNVLVESITKGSHKKSILGK